MDSVIAPRLRALPNPLIGSAPVGGAGSEGSRRATACEEGGGADSATTRLKSCVGIRGIALGGERRDCRKVAGMLAMVERDGCRTRGGAGSENPGVGGSIPSQPTILLSYLPVREFPPN